jgi:DNA polymerase III subunit alpha
MNAVIDRAIERAQKMQRERTSGQHGLFLGQPAPVEQPDDLPEMEEWPEHEILAAEYSTLGFYISGHPLDKYAGRLKDFGAVELGSLEGKHNAEDVVVAGIIVHSRPMRSRKGARWAIYTLQDRTGVVDLLVFPEAFARLESILRAGVALLVKGRISVEEVGTRVVASDIRPLEEMSQPAPGMMRVRVDLGAMDTATLDELQKIITSRPGRCKVEFELVNPDGTMATLEAESGVRPDPDLLQQVRDICGLDAVAILP